MKESGILNVKKNPEERKIVVSFIFIVKYDIKM